MRECCIKDRKIAFFGEEAMWSNNGKSDWCWLCAGHRIEMILIRLHRAVLISANYNYRMIIDCSLMGLSHGMLSARLSRLKAIDECKVFLVKISCFAIFSRFFRLPRRWSMLKLALHVIISHFLTHFTCFLFPNVCSTTIWTVLGEFN